MKKRETATHALNGRGVEFTSSCAHDEPALFCRRIELYDASVLSRGIRL